MRVFSVDRIIFRIEDPTGFTYREMYTASLGFPATALSTALAGTEPALVGDVGAYMYVRGLMHSARNGSSVD